MGAVLLRWFFFVLCFFSFFVFSSAVDYRGYYETTEGDSLVFRDIYSPSIALLSKNKTSNSSLVLSYRINDSSSLSNVSAYLFNYANVSFSDSVGGVAVFSSTVFANSSLDLEDTVPPNAFVLNSSLLLTIKNASTGFRLDLGNVTLFF